MKGKKVSQRQTKLYYRNVLAEVIGDEHGITPARFHDLAAKTAPVITWLNSERKAGKTPYRDLPVRTDISDDVKRLVSEVKDDCDNLVVLGIGGSALGNIALQTSLNTYMYNLDENQRSGPRLFVFDNIDPAQLGSFLEWVGDKLDKTIFNV